jgi:hypothetical protein
MMTILLLLIAKQLTEQKTSSVMTFMPSSAIVYELERTGIAGRACRWSVERQNGRASRTHRDVNHHCSIGER